MWYGYGRKCQYYTFFEIEKMKIIEKNISEIKEYSKNAKKHPSDQVKQIANSLKRFGWKQPLVIDSNNVLVVGHGRLLGAKEAGIQTAPCVIADDLTEAEIKAYRLADNKLNESEWDLELLDIELEELDELSDIDMSDFGFEILDEQDSDREIIEDDYDGEVPEEPRAKVGDIYQLGEHRLICGDSTDVNVIDRLMDGVKADCVFTDPPYNVAIGSKNAVLNEMNHAKRGHRVETEIAGDKGLTDAEIGEQLWRPAFQNMADYAKDDCSIYVTMPQGGTHMMMMMADACWQVKHELMWLKNQPTFSMGRLDYDYKHEPIMYGWKKTHNFYGKGKFTKSVWEIDKPRESKLHPTMKPIELIANALENSTKENDCVLDVFGGSGSTLIACEQLNRKCYMAELDPHYIDVIIDRYEKFTGKKAILISESEE